MTVTTFFIGVSERLVGAAAAAKSHTIAMLIDLLERALRRRKSILAEAASLFASSTLTAGFRVADGPLS